MTLLSPYPSALSAQHSSRALSAHRSVLIVCRRPDGFGPDQTGSGSDFIARERAIATRQRRSRGEKRE